MTAPILFFDIAGPAELNLASFYTKVFGWEADQTGQFAVTITPPLRGAFRPDPAEKRIYVGVADVTATLATVVEAGGKIDAPRFEVPGGGRAGPVQGSGGQRNGTGGDDRRQTAGAVTHSRIICSTLAKNKRGAVEAPLRSLGPVSNGPG